ncbi:MAG: hypothetical protein KAS12_05085 [Candidatus Aenigmarchaeota archaeon]|nr:hypothetical protein [Candidatus Aenigmarchaeota archaeon]
MPKKTEINVSKKDLAYILNGLEILQQKGNFVLFRNDYIFHKNHSTNLIRKLWNIYEEL